MIVVSRIPCAVCYLELAQCLVDAGYGTHLGCDPYETPDPKAVAAQPIAAGLTGRLRGQETARRERELSTGPDRPSRSYREERLMQPRVPSADDTRGDN